MSYFPVDQIHLLNKQKLQLLNKSQQEQLKQIVCTILSERNVNVQPSHIKLDIVEWINSDATQKSNIEINGTKVNTLITIIIQEYNYNVGDHFIIDSTDLKDYSNLRDRFDMVVAITDGSVHHPVIKIIKNNCPNQIVKENEKYNELKHFPLDIGSVHEESPYILDLMEIKDADLCETGNSKPHQLVLKYKNNIDKYYPIQVICENCNSSTIANSRYTPTTSNWWSTDRCMLVPYYDDVKNIHKKAIIIGRESIGLTLTFGYLDLENYTLDIQKEIDNYDDQNVLFVKSINQGEQISIYVEPCYFSSGVIFIDDGWLTFLFKEKTHPYSRNFLISQDQGWVTKNIKIN
jgi:hypothetical protein